MTAVISHIIFLTQDFALCFVIRTNIISLIMLFNIIVLFVLLLKKILQKEV